MKLNVDLAQHAVVNLARTLGTRARTCACGNSLKDAIITDRASIPAETAAKLEPIIGKYIKA
jgi:5'-methylthioadenosine phosphorylase